MRKFYFFTLKIHSHRVFRTLICTWSNYKHDGNCKVAYPRNKCLFALSLWNQTERILTFAESKTGNRVRKASGIQGTALSVQAITRF